MILWIFIFLNVKKAIACRRTNYGKKKLNPMNRQIKLV